MFHALVQRGEQGWRLQFYPVSQWNLYEQKSWHLQGMEKRRGWKELMCEQCGLELEGEWSSLAVVAARLSEVLANGPNWPNLMLVVRWPALVKDKKARGMISHSLQPVFFKDSRWLSKTRQVKSGAECNLKGEKLKENKKKTSGGKKAHIN